MGKENYQSNLQINLQYQILKLVSDKAKNHAFQAEIMPKIMNHAKIGKIMKNHEIMPAGALQWCNVSQNRQHAECTALDVPRPTNHAVVHCDKI